MDIHFRPMCKKKSFYLPSIFVFAFLSLTSLYSLSLAQTGLYQKYETPLAVMDILFGAAKSGDFSALGGLCDPEQKNDGDTDCICAIDIKYIPHNCSERQKKEINEVTFVEYFKDGSYTASPRIARDSAEVDFVFGPEGKVEETMHLVRRDGFWYLSSF